MNKTASKPQRQARPFAGLRHHAEESAAGLPALMAKAEKAAVSILAGEHTQRKTGTGEKFWQFREYDPSDRPHDIDWRQSAKGDRVYVRQKEWQTTQTALFWCQHDESMNYKSDAALSTKRETALVLSLALAILLGRAGEQIGPLDGSLRAGRSTLAHEKLGTHLYESPTAALPAPSGQSIPRNATLILTGDFLRPADQVSRMIKDFSGRAANAMMIQVLDPAELTLPFEGRVMFEETAGHERHNIEHVASVRDEYIKRIGNHLDEIKAQCRRHRWQWLLHTTDGDLRQTLFDAWSMMSPESFHSGGGSV